MILRLLGFVVGPHASTIIKTGLIYTATTPPGAKVFIDGRLAHETTPTVVRDLIPGEHTVRIELDGYKPWTKTVPVAGKKATALDNLLLLPTEWRITQITDKPYDDIVAINGTLIVGINQNVKDIDTIKINRTAEDQGNAQKNIEVTPLFPHESIYTDANLVRFFKEEKSPFILLEVMLNDKRKFLWMDLKEKPARIEDITDLFPQIPNSILWDPNDEKNIFAFYNEYNHRINIKAKAIYPQELNALPDAITKQLALKEEQQTILINNKANLLAHEGRMVQLYEKLDFAGNDSYPVVKTKAKTTIYFDERSGELFYLNEAHGFLCSVDILGHKPTLSLPMAETLRFKKAEP